MGLTVGNDADRHADGASGLIYPLQAASFRTHGLNHAAGAADEDLTIEESGRREGGDVAIESVSPFQFQFFDLFDVEAGHGGGLKAGVCAVRAPAIPCKLGAV